MLVISFAFIVLICYTAVLAVGLKNALASGNPGAFLATRHLFLVCAIKVYNLETFIFQKVQEGIVSSALFGLLGASNHFIMTLDIICIFISCLLYFYHKLKIAVNLPAEYSV